MRIVVSAIIVALGAGAVGAAPCTDLATIRQLVELACPCSDQGSPGTYKRCVKGKLKADGVKGSCKKQMMKTAAKSVCGKAGFVVCCQPGKKGKVVKTAKCRGTACQPGVANGFSVFPNSGSDCSAAGACPTTTTTTTTTTTVADTTSTTSSTTTTTLPNLCVGGLPNGTPETGEECDDGNLDPTDGCTEACTTCGSQPATVTPPETCDDGNLTSGDGCDANCRTTGCGNGLAVAPETCDDGNVSNNDSCPSDCIIDACVPNQGSDVPFTVTVAGSNDLGAITVLVDYPEGKVSLPGSGGSIPNGILTDYPSGATPGANDLDHALRNFVLGQLGSPLAGPLFTMHFESCLGADAAVVGDFTCTVLDASDSLGNPIPSGVTCSVTTS
jgi:cysteine-rich repeat protein